jgi:hypothetical protein
VVDFSYEGRVMMALPFVCAPGMARSARDGAGNPKAKAEGEVTRR